MDSKNLKRKKDSKKDKQKKRDEIVHYDYKIGDTI